MPKGIYLRTKPGPNKGKKMSEEQKVKLSIALKGRTVWNKGLPHTEKHRKALSDAAKKRITKEYKGKISKNCKLCQKSLRVFPHLKDKKNFCSKKCQGEFYSLNVLKEKHWNWKGGQKNYRHLQDKRYKTWRGSVFKRDNFICQKCGLSGVYVQAHHIKGWSKFPELRYVLENGMTLCLDCHKLTDNYKNKKNGNLELQ